MIKERSDQRESLTIKLRSAFVCKSYRTSWTNVEVFIRTKVAVLRKKAGDANDLAERFGHKHTLLVCGASQGPAVVRDRIKKKRNVLMT